MENLYKILNVSFDASQKEIKTQYKKLTDFYQPDRNLNAKIVVDRYKEILKAYEILSNPKRRADYDTLFLKKDQYITYHLASRKRANLIIMRIFILVVVIIAIYFANIKKSKINPNSVRRTELNKDSRPPTGEIDFKTK